MDDKSKTSSHLLMKWSRKKSVGFMLKSIYI